jgi:hypothetical protein
MIDTDLSFGPYIYEIVKKGNRMAVFLMRTIGFKSGEIMVPLFKSLLRPSVENRNSVWCPYLRKYCDLLEGVKRRYTKRNIGMKDINY